MGDCDFGKYDLGYVVNGDLESEGVIFVQRRMYRSESKMKFMCCVILVILFFFIVYEGIVKLIVQIYFMGLVVEVGCWNDVGILEI